MLSPIFFFHKSEIWKKKTSNQLRKRVRSVSKEAFHCIPQLAKIGCFSFCSLYLNLNLSLYKKASPGRAKTIDPTKKLSLSCNPNWQIFQKKKKKETLSFKALIFKSDTWIDYQENKRKKTTTPINKNHNSIIKSLIEQQKLLLKLISFWINCNFFVLSSHWWWNLRLQNILSISENPNDCN